MKTQTPACTRSELTPGGEATYCPEDNKLRLYVGRVPSEEFEFLRAEGWTSTPKQGCDFVAIWTPGRHATALQYADIIGDEDQSPEDRAADRAERFAGYRENRIDDATGHADRYEAGPSAHGFQSQARAERAAARHDRIGGRAYDAWEKAEYWQSRTAGVISHALYSSRPDVRMGRIKTIEAEQRKHTASIEAYAASFRSWKDVLAETDPGKAFQMAYALGNYCHGHSYRHPRPEHATDYERQHGTSLYSLLTHKADPITGHEAAALWLVGCTDPDSPEWENTKSAAWTRHFVLRLAYENQMLEAQGGRLASVEMVPGGWIAGRQIQKVNKSSATGRVVSVLVRDNKPSAVNHYGNPYPDGITKTLSHVIKTERLAQGAYRAPTPEELEAFHKAKKDAKKAAPKKDPCPLINPTDDDAQRLQDVLNERHADTWKERHPYKGAKEYQRQTVLRIKQATYSAASSGNYASARTSTLHRDAQPGERPSNMWSAAAKAREEQRGPALCKFRMTSGEGDFYSTPRVIIIIDAAQKPFPDTVWKAQAEPVAPIAEEVEDAAEEEAPTKAETFTQAALF